MRFLIWLLLASCALAQSEPIIGDGLIIGEGPAFAEVSAIDPPTASEIRTRLDAGQPFNAEATGMLLDYIGRKNAVNVADLMSDAELAESLSDDGFDADDLWTEALSRLGESGVIIFPAGKFNFSSTLSIHKRLHIIGEAFSHQAGNTPSNRPTVFKFPVDTHGMVIHRYDTDLETTGTNGNSASGTDRGDGSIIRGIDFQGGGGSSGHGIWMRARATIENCSCSGFAGNGLQIIATVSSTASDNYGNANDWIVRDCKFYSNGGHGMFVDGADANAGAAYSVNAQSNDGTGIYDSSFLGNIYVGCHTATNGTYSRCFNDGHRFQATDQVDTTTEPIAGMSWLNGDPWEDIGESVAHAIYPQWESGQPYAYNPGYRSDSDSARNVFIGCYSENDQADCLMLSPAQVIGGLQVAGIRGGALHLDGTDIRSQLRFREREDDDYAGMDLVVRGAYNQFYRFTFGDDHPHGLTLGINGSGNYAYYHGNLSSRTGLAFLTLANDLTFGRSDTDDHTPGTAHMPLGLIMGPANDARHMTYDDAAPVDGYHARGDIVYNNAPTAGGSIGWVCVTAGTPGTWKTFGDIAP